MGSLDGFQPLHYLQNRQEGFPMSWGWRTQLYSSLYTNMAQSVTTPLPPCDGHDWGSVFGFGFSTDGSLLAAACEKRSLLLYDPLNMKLIERKSDVHSDCVNCVRFLDNRIFATCSDDHTVKLWDMRNLKQQFRTLKGHTNWVKNIEYAPSTGKLVTSGFDGNIFTWSINNYSEKEEVPEPVLHISGIMRTVLTPFGDKMIISTLGGYFILIHNLNLETLREDMQGFKPHLMRIMQVLKVPLIANKQIFVRDRNRVEYMGDFPLADNAESISTMEVHPQGWCVASRNTTPDEDAEWTCVHDIQASSPKRRCSSKGARDGSSNQSSADGEAPPSSPPNVHISGELDNLLSNHSNTITCHGQSDFFLSSQDTDSDSSSGDADLSLLGRLNAEEEDIEEEEDDSDEDRHMSQSSNASTDPSSSSAQAGAQPSSHNVTATSSPPDLLTHRISTSIYTSSNGPSSVGQLSFLLRRYTPGPMPTPFPPTYRSPLGNLRPRLLYYLEEPNVGVGFIKEQSFSPEGRVLASPYKHCARLLAFNNSCSELCDCVPSSHQRMVQVCLTGHHKSPVLAAMFSPSQLLLATGSKDGNIVFSSPKL